MAIQVVERWKRPLRTGSSPGVEFAYNVTALASDPFDELLAEQAVKTVTPVLYNNNLVPSTYAVDVVGSRFIIVTVAYERRADLEVGGSSFTFDVTGGTQHITQSLATVNRYAPAGMTANNHKQAINVSDGKASGTDITVPKASFTRTVCLGAATVTASYQRTVMRLVGTMANATFDGWSVGEVLLTGVSGQQRSPADWVVTFRWAVSENVTNQTIGDITGISKRGWDYLWCEYRDAAGASGIVAKPIGVHVEQVYKLGDFSLLGI